MRRVFDLEPGKLCLLSMANRKVWEGGQRLGMAQPDCVETNGVLSSFSLCFTCSSTSAPEERLLGRVLNGVNLGFLGLKL